MKAWVLLLKRRGTGSKLKHEIEQIVGSSVYRTLGPYSVVAEIRSTNQEMQEQTIGAIRNLSHLIASTNTLISNHPMPEEPKLFLNQDKVLCFSFIEADLDQTNRIQKMFIETEGVICADQVYGSYDLVVKISGKSLSHIGKILDTAKDSGGINRSTTMIAF